ncbi:thioredoxin-like domain-containing protein [Longimicrobium sp.]|uniref:thioredoxin-like domain-containing protein n=1 Tax=Longimicrobium sp. TaxID=2029185 RepID=UPI002D1B2E6C|nr:thioredoxin-like domain-containing protein [Longimicrobium sp.]HSU14167.1 thioredoxin-like domain-containing protein [Longimicrobium sp.]
MAVRAPDFRPELEWINTGGRHLTLADFRGRILVLDFWTYGCINCLHMIPELAELERRFPDEVIVAGVHSGKFINERVTANIARACERLGVHHPVLNDRQFRTWREYTVNAWPTLAVVSPDGYVLGMQPGEVTAEQLTPVIGEFVDALRRAGKMGGAPAPFVPQTQPPEPGILRFPAKAHAAADGQLFVADTGHHRVLQVALDGGGASGRVLRAYGSGEAGWMDGDAGSAAFRAPHGLALADRTLYVADTGNHLVRAIDLNGERVATVAGVGDQARQRYQGGPALDTPLNSPWDLLWKDGRLYVAMAGPHQLWRIDPDAGAAEVFAGSGAEEVYDAELPLAALAQPSGIATDGNRIWFADAESSAIRYAVAGADVRTIVGTGLFDFGDQDGTGDDVRLQHAQGLAWWPGERKLLVADTYNHRVKTVDPYTREARAFAGSGEAGLMDGDGEAARFWEPGGISVTPDGARAYVADTNNHALRVIDLATRQVRTVELREG